jgi:DNA-binding transcriptional regulator/RsmH inhibitor MraZ
VTLVGIFDHIELWPTDEWEQHVKDSLPSYGEVLYEASDNARAEQNRQP